MNDRHLRSAPPSSAERHRLARTLTRLVGVLSVAERVPTMFFEENGEAERG